MIPTTLLKVFTPYVRVTRPGFFIFGHGVTDKPIINPLIQGLHLELHLFNSMINLWSDMGFRFLTMEEAMEISLGGKRVDYPWIHLTFDDGYKNNYTVLYPYLKSRNIPFTVFLSTRNITEQNRFDNYKIICGLYHSSKKENVNSVFKELHIPDSLSLEDQIINAARVFKYLPVKEKEIQIQIIEELLSREEWDKLDKIYDSDAVLSLEDIKTMSQDSLVHFGSHGHNHYILSTLSNEEIQFEQSESGRIIEQLTGKPVNTYCYPNGKQQDYPDNIGEFCKKNNYEIGFTTDQKKVKPGCKPYEVPRFPLSERFLPKLFIKLLS